MGHGRRIVLYCAVVIGVAGTAAWYLHHGPERAARSSGPAAVPVTVATATKRDFADLSYRTRLTSEVIATGVNVLPCDRGGFFRQVSHLRGQKAMAS